MSRITSRNRAALSPAERATCARWAALLFLALLGCLAAPAARAEEPTPSMPNQCPEPGGQGLPCQTDGDCVPNTYAKTCVEHQRGVPSSRACEISCGQGTGIHLVREPAACAVGETCVEGRGVSARAYYCKASSFRVDLNLLDQCVVQYLSGLQPAFTENLCSLDANLNALLDQTGDRVYDIFDLDLCVLAFLEQKRCDPTTATCPSPELVYCASDSDCGTGLYCDAERSTCQRDCGIIAPREEMLSSLNRQCTGARKTCDYERGRCETIDVTPLTCQIDGDCPAGAYCLVGRCAPSCYRAIDCPSSDWYCSRNNHCRALPPADADAGYEFDPQNYAIRFVRDSLRLDSIQNTDSSTLAIMDLQTKQRVVDNPSVNFGYRLEVKYGLKQDLECAEAVTVNCEETTNFSRYPWAKDRAGCQATQKDCIISDTEEWVRLESPFGTVSARGTAALELTLEAAVADKLSPGRYTAQVRAIFDNGDSDTLPVTFTKASPSGEYVGSIDVYDQVPERSLTGTRPLSVGVRLEVTEAVTKWNELMKAHHLDASADSTEVASPLIDITSGQVVRGRLHGGSALAFTKGDAMTSDADEIPLIGLYSPNLGRLRMVAVIDVAEDFCISEEGPCSAEQAASTDDDAPLMVRNLFGRKLRRQLEFVGPFDEATGRFSGLYRETFSGLVPDGAVTLSGDFVLTQALADSSRKTTQDGLLLPAGTKAVAFPGVAALKAQLASDEVKYCQSGAVGAPATTKARAEARAAFLTSSAFKTYLGTAKASGTATADSPLGRTTIFPNLVDFSDTIKLALSSLGKTTTEEQRQHLNIYEFLADRILPCDDADPKPGPGCIDEDSVHCGLTLYRKALLSEWVDVDKAKNTSGDADAFCLDTLPTEGCETDTSKEPELFALQDHNRFWRNAAAIQKFEADRGRSDAFLVLFRNAINPFAQGAALSYKSDKLRDAVRRYDNALSLMVSPVATDVLFAWPATAFKESGRDWLDLLSTLAQDRMDALADLVDLRRRVFLNTGSRDMMFAQHLMQQEYLTQVYLMQLYKKWLGGNFAYKGEGGLALEQGRRIVAQLDAGKNVLGIEEARVFFENGDPNTTNWAHYRELLLGSAGKTGMVASAEAKVQTAVGELKRSMADLDTLESKLFEQRTSMENSLAEMCGDPRPWDATSLEGNRSCQALFKTYHEVPLEAWTKLYTCMNNPNDADDGCDPEQGVDCDMCKYFPIQCRSNAGWTNPFFAGGTGPSDTSNYGATCATTMSTFDSYIAWADGTYAFDATAYPDRTDTQPTGSELLHAPPTCALEDLANPSIWIDVDGTSHPCAGGGMRTLLQQREALIQERRLILDEFQAQVWDLSVWQEYFKQQSDSRDEMMRALDGMHFTSVALQSLLDATEHFTDEGDELLKAVECIMVVGLASGTDCPQKAAATGAKRAKNFVLKHIAWAIGTARTTLDETASRYQTGAEYDMSLVDSGLDLERYSWSWMGMVRKYERLSQAIFNVGLEIDDLQFQVQRTVDLYRKRVSFVSDHLVGRESGNVLLGDHLVAEASRSFRDILLFTHKMTVAFAHHYNLAPGDTAQLVNQAHALVTLDDVRAFLDRLSERERDYCGLESIDCDAGNNVSVLRLSLREQLFPQLMDRVDGKTGTLLTKGQQFHNLITQPPFLTRRVRGSLTVDQLELPFGVLYELVRNTPSGKPQWLIDPLTCNHMLDARRPDNPGFTSNGNVALNVMGRNLGDGSLGLKYELIRGSSDVIRACHLEPVVKEVGTLPVLEYPLQEHIIGFAPQSSEAQEDAVPTYYTRSNPFPACLNGAEKAGALSDSSCWRFFGRDRSLGSLDWKLVVPLHAGEGATDNGWLVGDGLPAAERPVIEDLVLYFRYRSRPVQE